MMDSRVKAFYDGVKGKKIAFFGVGITNTPIMEKLAACGAHCYAHDRRDRAQWQETADALEAQGITIVDGEHYLDQVDADVVFRTPGMNFFHPTLEALRRRGVAVTSEMEVFFDLCPARLFAVTGSDGKTTTTTLIYEMLKAQGKNVFLGGNIGKPVFPLLETLKPEDFVVVELSSFQLISMRRSPDVAVVTNVAPNHLDVHKDMQEYIDAKKNILLHQSAFGKCVLNRDNEITAGFVPLCRGSVFQFSRRDPVENGAFLDGDGMLCMSEYGKVTRLFPAKEIRVPGVHNIENYLTAISAVWGYVSFGTMEKVAREFGGVEHRIEFVREIDRVRYYNDSIGTSPTRTMAGLRAFDKNVVLIAGGYDKKIPFEPLAPIINERVKALILMGKTAPKIQAAVENDPAYDPSRLKILHVSGMEQAVGEARKISEEGDVVLMSPACASFDMYVNFEQRGEHFKQIVRALR